MQTVAGIMKRIKIDLENPKDLNYARMSVLLKNLQVIRSGTAVRWRGACEWYCYEMTWCVGGTAR